MAETKKRQQLDSLTSLRWIAAIPVFSAHAVADGQLIRAIPGATVAGTFAAGASGVCFFFVLSGFVLTWTYRPGRLTRDFYRDRFARVWPLHAFAVAFAVIALAPVVISKATIKAFVSGPTLLSFALGQSWVPKLHWYLGGNEVAWSLSCEALFYALFPLLVRWVLKSKNPWWIAIGSIVSIFVIAVIGGTMSHPMNVWFGYYFPIARVPEFLLGIVIARIVKEDGFPRLPVSPFLALAGVTVFASRWVPDTYKYAAVSVIPMALLVAVVATAETAGQTMGLQARWLVRLGELSYAFYVFHANLIVAAVRLLAKTHIMILSTRTNGHLLIVVTAGIFLAAIGVSWLANVLIERPFQRLLRAPRPATGTGRTAVSS